MSADALSTSMFWVGAMFVLTPLLCGGVVIGVWWYQRRKLGRADSAQDR